MEDQEDILLAIPADKEPVFDWTDFDDGLSDIESEKVIDLSSPNKNN